MVKSAREVTTDCIQLWFECLVLVDRIDDFEKDIADKDAALQIYEEVIEELIEYEA
jgi:hypothetical protein